MFLFLNLLAHVPSSTKTITQVRNIDLKHFKILEPNLKKSSRHFYKELKLPRLHTSHLRIEFKKKYLKIKKQINIFHEK